MAPTSRPPSRHGLESPATLVGTKGADKGWVGATVLGSKSEICLPTECLIPAQTRWAALEGGQPALPRLPMPPARALLLLLSFNMLCSLFSSFYHEIWQYDGLSLSCLHMLKHQSGSKLLSGCVRAPGL